MIIRDVEDRDSPEIAKFAKEFMEYAPLHVDYNINELLKFLEHVSEEAIFIVPEKDGKAVGMAAAAVTPHPYSPMYLLGTELFLWVDPEHRSGTVGPRLLKALEQRIKESGCKYISMTSTVHTPNFKKYLLKQGYIEAETAYMKEI